MNCKVKMHKANLLPWYFKLSLNYYYQHFMDSSLIHINLFLEMAIDLDLKKLNFGLVFSVIVFNYFYCWFYESVIF